MSLDSVHARSLPVGGGEKADPELLRVARDFERMLLRTMLSQLEKSIHVGGGSPMAGGSSVYSSMIVDALADAVANAGGIGLAEKVAQSMQPEMGHK